MDTEQRNKSIAVAKRIGLGLGKVANVLDAYNTEKGGNIRIHMDERCFQFYGMPMSLSGLYAVATTSKEKLEKGNVFHQYGAELIAKECGLRTTNYDDTDKELKEWVSDTERNLEDWAYGSNRLKFWAWYNPHFWGNEYGAMMFSDKKAYGIKGIDDLTLSGIIAYFRAVAKRCDKA